MATELTPRSILIHFNRLASQVRDAHAVELGGSTISVTVSRESGSVSFSAACGDPDTNFDWVRVEYRLSFGFRKALGLYQNGGWQAVHGQCVRLLAKVLANETTKNGQAEWQARLAAEFPFEG